MKALRSKLKNLDSFGEIPSLMVKGNKTTKSPFGGFLTLLKFIILIFLLIYYFKKFIENRKITTVNEKRTRVKDEVLNIPLNYMNFSILILDWSGEQVRSFPLNEISYTLNQQIRYANPPKNLNYPILLDRCNNPNSYSYKQGLKFKYLNLTDCIYFKYNQDEIKLGSNSTLRSVMKFNSQIDLCPAFRMDSSKCKDLEYLSEISGSKSNNYSLIVYYDEAQPSMSDSSGYNIKFTGIRNFIDLSLDYYMILTINRNVLYNDNNFIFDFIDNSEEVFYTIESSTISKSRNTKFSNYLSFSILIELSPEDIVYYRTYEKLDDVFSKIFSFFQICNFFLKTFNFLISSDHFNSILIKNILSINFEEKLRTQNNQRLNIIKEHKPSYSKELESFNFKQDIYCYPDLNFKLELNKFKENKSESNKINEINKNYFKSTNFAIETTKETNKNIYKFRKCICIHKNIFVWFKRNKKIVLLNYYLNKIISFEIDLISILKRIMFLETTLINIRDNVIINNVDIENLDQNQDNNQIYNNYDFYDKYYNNTKFASKNIYYSDNTEIDNYENEAERYKYY